MLETLYQKLENAKQDNLDVIIHKFGKETEFEAICRIERDPESSVWEGYLVFKSNILSPEDDHIPQIQFKYMTPSGASGVVALNRTDEYWRTLCKVFQTLRNTTVVTETV